MSSHRYSLRSGRASIPLDSSESAVKGDPSDAEEHLASPIQWGATVKCEWGQGDQSDGDGHSKPSLDAGARSEEGMDVDGAIQGAAAVADPLSLGAAKDESAEDDDDDDSSSNLSEAPASDAGTGADAEEEPVPRQADLGVLIPRDLSTTRGRRDVAAPGRGVGGTHTRVMSMNEVYAAAGALDLPVLIAVIKTRDVRVLPLKMLAEVSLRRRLEGIVVRRAEESAADAEERASRCERCRWLGVRCFKVKRSNPFTTRNRPSFKCASCYEAREACCRNGQGPAAEVPPPTEFPCEGPAEAMVNHVLRERMLRNHTAGRAEQRAADVAGVSPAKVVQIVAAFLFDRDRRNELATMLLPRFLELVGGEGSPLTRDEAQLVAESFERFADLNREE